MVQSWHLTKKKNYTSTDKDNVTMMTMKVSNDRATTKVFLGPRHGRSPVIVHLSPLEAQLKQVKT